MFLSVINLRLSSGIGYWNRQSHFTLNENHSGAAPDQSSLIFTGKLEH